MRNRRSTVGAERLDLYEVMLSGTRVSDAEIEAAIVREQAALPDGVVLPKTEQVFRSIAECLVCEHLLQLPVSGAEVSCFPAGELIEVVGVDDYNDMPLDIRCVPVRRKELDPCLVSEHIRTHPRYVGCHLLIPTGLFLQCFVPCDLEVNPLKVRMIRQANLHRKTGETDVKLSLNLDAPYAVDIELGDRFLNNFLGSFLRQLSCGIGGELKFQASGDIEVDYHHLVEDVALVLGEALSKCLGERRGINRYGFFHFEGKSLQVEVAVDLGSRPYLVYNIEDVQQTYEDFDLGLIQHFFRSLSDTVGMNLHINQTGTIEVCLLYVRMFRAVGEALKMAMTIDPRAPDQIHSSKGSLRM